MKKFFSIILSLLMMCSFTLTACNNNDTPHTCSSKCSVCQLCTDEDCTDSACTLNGRAKVLPIIGKFKILK